MIEQKAKGVEGEFSRAIFVQIDSLRTDITYLEQEIEKLEARLKPIMSVRPMSDSVGEDDGPVPSISPIAETLMDFGSALQRLRRRVLTLNEDVEI